MVAVGLKRTTSWAYPLLGFQMQCNLASFTVAAGITLNLRFYTHNPLHYAASAQIGLITVVKKSNAVLPYSMLWFVFTTLPPNH